MNESSFQSDHPDPLSELAKELYSHLPSNQGTSVSSGGHNYVHIDAGGNVSFRDDSKNKATMQKVLKHIQTIVSQQEVNSKNIGSIEQLHAYVEYQQDNYQSKSKWRRFVDKIKAVFSRGTHAQLAKTMDRLNTVLEQHLINELTLKVTKGNKGTITTNLGKHARMIEKATVTMPSNQQGHEQGKVSVNLVEFLRGENDNTQNLSETFNRVLENPNSHPMPKPSQEASPPSSQPLSVEEAAKQFQRNITFRVDENGIPNLLEKTKIGRHHHLLEAYKATINEAVTKAEEARTTFKMPDGSTKIQYPKIILQLPILSEEVNYSPKIAMLTILNALQSVAKEKPLPEITLELYLPKDSNREAHSKAFNELLS